MPVRARHSKRRASSQADIEAWGEVFEHHGVDYFGVLAVLGYPYPWGSEIPRDDLRRAWNQFGRAWLANHSPNYGDECWALQEFGEPACR